MADIERARQDIDEYEQEDAIDAMRMEKQVNHAGLYRLAMKWITSRAGDNSIHLDAHSASSEFALRLSQSNIKKNVLAVHPNPYLAINIARMFRNRYAISSAVMPAGEGMVRREYRLHNEKLRNTPFAKEGPGLWTIHDDVRSAGVLRAILGDQKIDSASMLFPVAPLAGIYQAPFMMPESELDLAMLVQRTNRIEKETRNAMFNTAAEFMKPGGTLLMGWFAAPGEKGAWRPSPNDFPALKFWDRDRKEPGVMLDDLPPFPGRAAVIARFIRDKTKWEPTENNQ